MKKIILSEKGKKLLNLYTTMIKDGYKRTDGTYVKNVYNDFELKKYALTLKPVFSKFSIKEILDYGSGGSNWDDINFDLKNKRSAKDFFELSNVFYYEPARKVNQLKKVDCVVCFDVLEHIFIGDLKNVINHIYAHANKLVILQIACYDSAAILPNEENAHVTVRNPDWWKGFIDSLVINYPKISTLLICSIAYKKPKAFNIWSSKQWFESKSFKINF